MGVNSIKQSKDLERRKPSRELQGKFSTVPAINDVVDSYSCKMVEILDDSSKGESDSSCSSFDNESQGDKRLVHRASSSLVVSEMVEMLGYGRYHHELLLVVGGGLHGLVGAGWTSQVVYLRDALSNEFGLDQMTFPLCSTFYFVGWAAGVGVFCHMSDRIGRLPTLMIIHLIGAFAAFLSSIAPTFALFCTCRFLLGGLAGGNAAVSYMLLVESSGYKTRGFLSNLNNIAFAVSLAITAIESRYLQHYDWRTQVILLQVIVPLLLLPPTYLLCRDSPHWAATYRADQPDIAMGIIRYIAKQNKVVLPKNSSLQTHSIPNNCSSKRKKSTMLSDGSVMSQLLTPSIFKSLVIVVPIWLVTAFVYYGLTFQAGELSGDIFSNEIRLALAEAPSYIFCYLLVDRPGFGRKGTLTLSLLLTSFSLIIISSGLCPESHISTFSMLGKFGASSAFSTTYIFTAELFPTRVRGAVMGLCQASARIGSMSAPFIIDLSLTAGMVAFASTAMAAALLSTFLRETLGGEMRELETEMAKKKDFVDENQLKKTYEDVESRSVVGLKVGRRLNSKLSLLGGSPSSGGSSR